MAKTGPRNRVAMLPDVAAERLDLADFLDTLDEPQWVVDSLCPGWAVHDVVAHLTLSTRQSVAATMVRVIRARGDFNRAVAEMARERAREFGPAELIAQLREMASSPSRFPLSGRLDPLTDILVHSQDIASGARCRWAASCRRCGTCGAATSTAPESGSPGCG